MTILNTHHTNLNMYGVSVLVYSLECIACVWTVQVCSTPLIYLYTHTHTDTRAHTHVILIISLIRCLKLHCLFDSCFCQCQTEESSLVIPSPHFIVCVCACVWLSRKSQLSYILSLYHVFCINYVGEWRSFQLFSKWIDKTFSINQSWVLWL